MHGLLDEASWKICCARSLSPSPSGEEVNCADTACAGAAVPDSVLREMVLAYVVDRVIELMVELDGRLRAVA